MDLKCEALGGGLSPPDTNLLLHCLTWVSVAFLPRQAACRLPCHITSHQGPRHSWGPFPSAPNAFHPVAVILSILVSLLGFCFSLPYVFLSLCPCLSPFVVWLPPCLCVSVSLFGLHLLVSGSISHSPHPHPPSPAGGQ